MGHFYKLFWDYSTDSICNSSKKDAGDTSRRIPLGYLYEFVRKYFCGDSSKSVFWMLLRNLMDYFYEFHKRCFKDSSMGTSWNSLECFRNCSPRSSCTIMLDYLSLEIRWNVYFTGFLMDYTIWDSSKGSFWNPLACFCWILSIVSKESTSMSFFWDFYKNPFIDFCYSFF